MNFLKLTVIFVVSYLNVDTALGHGRMLEPPMRSSAWRYGFPTPKNYNDNELNCGGFPNQEAHGGRCGPCGDRWQGPRENEAGGKYATGTIVREYAIGQVINVTVEVTSNHKGYFEFRLCPNNNPRRPVTQGCFDRYVLNIIGYGQRYVITAPDVRVFIELKLSLPPGITCSQCVLQWKWRAAQNRGPDGKGGECFGCGPQEHFINCADIAIAGGKRPVPLNRPSGAPQAHVFTSKKSSSSATSSSYGNDALPQQQPSMTSIDISMVPYADPASANFNEVNYYESNAQNTMNNIIQPEYSPYVADNFGYYNQPSYTAPVVSGNSVQQPTQIAASNNQQNSVNQYQSPATNNQYQSPATNNQYQSSAVNNQYQSSAINSQVDKAILSYTSTLTSGASESAYIECPDEYTQPTCKAVTVFSKMEAFNKWCGSMCPTGLCPSGMCSCECPATNVRHHQQQPQQQTMQCRGIPGWSDPTIDQFCQKNCQLDNCPSEFCVCNEYP